MTLVPAGPAALEVLALLVAVAADEDVELPARRYLSAGRSGGEAWDCPQVTVALVSLDPQMGFAGGADSYLAVPEVAGATPLPTLLLGVSIVRRVPVVSDSGDPPPAASEQYAGLVALTDAALLRALAVRAARAGALAHAGSVTRGPIVGTGPEGGYAAMTCNLGITLI